MAGSRYSRVAMILHWLIAACVVAMVPMGLWMSDAVRDPQTQQTAYRLFQLHKAIGFTILGLTVLRLVWRLTHPVPPLPAGMKRWEAFSARAVHAAFYTLLIAMPLTGWIYVSTGWAASMDEPLQVATSFFGLFTIPHLPWIADAAVEARRELAFHALGAHELVAWGAVVLFVLHVAAALKHQLVDRDGVLASMVPWLPMREEAAGPRHMTAAAALFGILLIAGLAAAGWLSSRPEPGTAAAEVQRTSTPAPAIDTSITPGTATEWSIDQSDSSIEFSGNHAGSDFRGRFQDWEGHVWFDPENLAGSRAIVFVRTGSARTGDATQEGSLAQAEWFDVESFPVARFEAEVFRSLGGNRFEADGTLAIKQATVPVTLPFTFTPSGDTARVEGHLELDRMALDLGMQSDPDGGWVSQMIDVNITVSASRK